MLRWARESIGVSLDEAARRAGVPVQRVEAWETGQAEPTVAKIFRRALDQQEAVTLASALTQLVL
ncbi:MAG: helix-turn-helix domain-containing protein [Sciscionella sp.]